MQKELFMQGFHSRVLYSRGTHVGDQREKTTHPHILSRSPRPIFTGFWRTFFHNFTTIFRNCLMTIWMFLAAFGSILMIIDSFDDFVLDRHGYIFQKKLRWVNLPIPPSQYISRRSPSQDRVNDFKVFFS